VTAATGTISFRAAAEASAGGTYEAGGARAVRGEGSVRSAAASSPGEHMATTAWTQPRLVSGALSTTL